jgi:hypothetical protein
VADLDDLTAFAQTQGLDLTKPLSHQRVVNLAEEWIPEVRFHELERFHPVDVSAMLTVPPPIFAAMSEDEKIAFRVPVALGFDPEGEPIFDFFDPPVVVGPVPGPPVGFGAAAIDAMDELDELGGEPRYTHGANRTSARRYFGASTAVSGSETPSPGDPRTPRHLPIVVHAEFRMLREALMHEIQLDELPLVLDDYGRPIDAIWPGFAVEREFFRSDDRSGRGFSRTDMRNILAAMIIAQENGDSEAEAEARSRIPEGWHLVEKAWTVLTTYAFLEYYFFYAFNDFADYADAGEGLFANEHEGDVEGCCLVIERERLERYARGELPAADVVPHSIITSAHEEWQELDELKRLPIQGDRARRDLKVYSAVGSHASYLTAGDHDILDWEDVLTDIPFQGGSVADVIVVLALPIIAPYVLLLALFEFLLDVEDSTSDNGAAIGPAPPDPDNNTFGKRIEVTPLSDIDRGVNIYQDVPAQRARLPIRGFRGVWGGYDGLLDHSPPWRNKTSRYFRRLVRSDNVEPEGPIVD